MSIRRPQDPGYCQAKDEKVFFWVSAAVEGGINFAAREKRQTREKIARAYERKKGRRKKKARAIRTSEKKA